MKYSPGWHRGVAPIAYSIELHHQIFSEKFWKILNVLPVLKSKNSVMDSVNEQ